MCFDKQVAEYYLKHLMIMVWCQLFLSLSRQYIGSLVVTVQNHFNLLDKVKYFKQASYIIHDKR